MHTHHHICTSKIASRAFLLALGLALCGCTTIKKAEEEDKPKATPPKLVGRIASVPPERKFVLIQSYGPWDIAIGSILTTRGEEDRTANLIFTGEKLGQFAAADIQSGTVERGDAVYSHHTPKPSAESLPSPTESLPTTYEDPAEELPETTLDPPLPE
jgi:hypothetical protein